MSNYSWTDNPTKANVAVYDPDVLNECLMYLKYSNNNYFSPYSVNQALRDSQGQADFIEKVDNSEILIKGNSETIVLTYSNGQIDEISEDLSVAVINNDGTYVLIKEVDVAPVLTESKVDESCVEPANSNDGDYWLDISGKPYKSYKKVSGAWVETQFVKLGEVTKTSGVLGTPISYALNAKAILSQSVGVDTTYSFAHNLGCDVKNIMHKGYFNNISSVGSGLTAGTSGYEIGVGINDNSGYYYLSAIQEVTSNSLKLVTGQTRLWYGGAPGRAFSNADAEIIVRRAF